MKLLKLEKHKNKLYIFLVFILGLFGFYYSYKLVNVHEVELTDAIKFKREYESLNDTIRENTDKKMRSISIPEDNPFVYKEAKDIIEMINNKESFIVYFGFSDCPWCRSMVPSLIDVARDYKVSKIYYVDVKSIRDVIELNADKKLVTTKEGTEDYYKLVKLLSNVLEDYNLKDEKNKPISTGKKRIYAPNIVTVIEGSAKEMTSAISSLQKDAYMEISEDMKIDMYNKIKCMVTCLNDSKNTCSIKSSC